MAFELQEVGLTIGRKEILQNISVGFPKGKFIGLLGHNGSGKSSLMRIMARQQALTSGSVRLFGRGISSFGEQAFARHVAYLPQETGAASDMKVRELVACGRYPWHGALGRFSKNDRRKVEHAMAATNLDSLSERMVGSLSGGERQRAWLAMLIAQDSQCLLLDEPTAALDISYQLEVLSLVRKLCHEQGLSVVIVIHDINMAARFCDYIHALKGGRVIASGRPSDIVSEAALRAIYDVDMGIVRGQDLATPVAYVR